MANAKKAYTGKAGNPAYNSCRERAQLDGATNYIVLPSTLDLSGDFEVEFWINKNSIVNSIVMGTNTASPDRFFIGFTDNQLLVGNGTDNSPVGVLNSGIDYLITWKSVSGTITATIDGVQVYSSARSGSPVTNINDVGRQSGGSFPCNAQTWGYKVWTGGDRSTGTLVLSMNVNDGFSVSPNIKDQLTGNNGTMVMPVANMWSEVCK